MTPQTDYILVRSPRTGPTIKVTIEKKDYDLTGYSFLQMRTSTEIPIEEWVPTDELELYKRVFEVK